MSIEQIAERLAAVRARGAAAAERSGRAADQVALVGVSKRKGPEMIAAAARAGLRDVGEISRLSSTTDRP